MPSFRRALSITIGLIVSSVFSATSSGRTDATSSAASVRNDFEIHGITGQARHMHGGPPAQIGDARFTFANRSAKPRQVTVTDIESTSATGTEAIPQLHAVTLSESVRYADFPNTSKYFGPNSPSTVPAAIFSYQLRIVTKFQSPADTLHRLMMLFGRITFD